MRGQHPTSVWVPLDWAGQKLPQSMAGGGLLSEADPPLFDILLDFQSEQNGGVVNAESNSICVCDKTAILP